MVCGPSLSRAMICAPAQGASGQRGGLLHGVVSRLTCPAEAWSSAVVKAQVHAGGRGKAGGVKLVRSRDEAIAALQRALQLRPEYLNEATQTDALLKADRLAEEQPRQHRRAQIADVQVGRRARRESACRTDSGPGWGTGRAHGADPARKELSTVRSSWVILPAQLLKIR